MSIKQNNYITTLTFGSHAVICIVAFLTVKQNPDILADELATLFTVYAVSYVFLIGALYIAMQDYYYNCNERSKIEARFDLNYWDLKDSNIVIVKHEDKEYQVYYCFVVSHKSMLHGGYLRLEQVKIATLTNPPNDEKVDEMVKLYAESAELYSAAP